jgi:4-amino-4-deoxychorismate lyase
MSDQSALSDRDTGFGLIETLLWTRAEGFALLPEHLARLAASSAALGVRHDEEKGKAALAAAVSPSPIAERIRVRLVLSEDGSIDVTTTPIDLVPPETLWRVALAERRFSSADPLLRHKITRRALYEDALAEAAKRLGADEVLFLNERDEICESARCNLFVPDGQRLLTPPASGGLLPGTLRAQLIADGRASEAVLRLDDLGGQFLLGNSVRGLVRAALLH